MSRSRSRSTAPREPVPLVIEKLSHEGRGLARHEGKVVFVEGALPQEQVLARLVRNRGAYSEAAVVEIIERSATRVDPPCSHYHACGGCSLQHMDTVSQLDFKSDMLHERLAHAARGKPYEILPVLSAETSGYRRKARLGVRHVPGKGRVLVGFREKHTNFITDMDSCEILVSAVSRLLPELSHLIDALEARASVPQIEVAVGDEHPDRNSIALIFRHLRELVPEDRQLLENFGSRHEVDVYLQPKGPDSAHRLGADDGRPDRLYYSLPDFGLELAFHPLDFTQVNAGINRRMIRQALTLLEPGSDDRVLDLFCGLGNFTLPVATMAGFVTGVEGVDALVARGRENAERNRLGNVDFHTADLAADHENYAWLKEGYNKVLLDPPRSGALEIIPALVAIRPERIVYVSCNPATLARDAELLASEGYSLDAAGAMDMFPHTSHVEAMALFSDQR